MVMTAYAECWAGVHMMMSVEPWRSHTPEFVTALTQGVPTEEALRQIFHVSIDELESSVRNYAKHWNPHLTPFDVPNYRETVEPDPVASDPYDVRFVLADSIPERSRRIDALREVAAAFPKRPEPEATLAIQMWHAQGVRSAKPDFQKALENGSTNTRVLWEYAKLLVNERDPNCLTVMDRILQLEPTRDDVKMLKAQWYVMQNHTQEALQVLDTISAPPAGQEVVYYESLMVSTYAAGQYDRAKIAIGKLRTLSLTPDQERRVQVYAKPLGL
jgi:hypothetical protein